MLKVPAGCAEGAGGHVLKVPAGCLMHLLISNWCVPLVCVFDHRNDKGWLCLIRFRFFKADCIFFAILLFFGLWHIVWRERSVGTLTPHLFCSILCCHRDCKNIPILPCSHLFTDCLDALGFQNQWRARLLCGFAVGARQRSGPASPLKERCVPYYQFFSLPAFSQYILYHLSSASAFACDAGATFFFISNS